VRGGSLKLRSRIFPPSVRTGHELSVLEDHQVSTAHAPVPDGQHAEPGLAPEQGTTLRIAITSAPPGLRLAGEIDATTHDAFRQALAVATRSCDGDVHADLCGVSFIDVDGLRALVVAATTMGPERMLVLHSIPAHVARLLELTGWDEAPGLLIEGGGR